MSDYQENKNGRREHWIEILIPISLITGLVYLLSVAAKNPPQELEAVIPREDLLNQIAGYLILVAEGTAALIIGAAVIQAFISYVRHVFDPISRQINYTEQIRLRLGHSLNLGLEFAMASDILRIAISPSTADMTILLSIVLLRILLNFFLARELRASTKFFSKEDYSPPSQNLHSDQ
ncbi:MAG: DUF1622 domain-containing protein [Brevefilum sp.]|jgi:uncharacterized membrane protein